MQPTPELLQRIHTDKIRQARVMHPIDKFLAGPRLRDIAWQRMLLGLSITHPDITVEQANEIIRQRFARQRERKCRPWTQ